MRRIFISNSKGQTLFQEREYVKREGGRRILGVGIGIGNEKANEAAGGYMSDFSPFFLGIFVQLRLSWEIGCLSKTFSFCGSLKMVWAGKVVFFLFFFN